MKLQKTSQCITPFAGIFFVTGEFNRCNLAKLIDEHLGTLGSGCAPIKMELSYIEQQQNDKTTPVAFCLLSTLHPSPISVPNKRRPHIGDAE